MGSIRGVGEAPGPVPQPSRLSQPVLAHVRVPPAGPLQAGRRAAGTQAEGHGGGQRPRREGDAIGHKGEVGRYFDEMVASYVVETERWEAAGKLIKAPGSAEDGKASALPLYTRGLVEAQKGLPGAEASVAELQALRKQEKDAGQARRAKPDEAP